MGDRLFQPIYLGGHKRENSNSMSKYGETLCDRQTAFYDSFCDF